MPIHQRWRLSHCWFLRRYAHKVTENYMSLMVSRAGLKITNPKLVCLLDRFCGHFDILILIHKFYILTRGLYIIHAVAWIYSGSKCFLAHIRHFSETHFHLLHPWCLLVNLFCEATKQATSRPTNPLPLLSARPIAASEGWLSAGPANVTLATVGSAVLGR